MDYTVRVMGIAELAFAILNVYFVANVVLWFFSVIYVARSRAYLKPGRVNPRLSVTVLLPLYREEKRSVITTLKSVARQKYPKKLVEVVLVVEPDDDQTKQALTEAVKYLSRKGIRCRVVESDGRVKLKAHALNQALKTVDSDVIAVYDADDVFPPDQFAKAIALIEQGYDAVGVRVSRYRDSIVGRYLFVDLAIWYELLVPLFYKLFKYAPLSGEGLFIKREALEAIGGFPEILAEDAGLTIMLASKKLKVALLDSWVEELAPKNVVSAIKQRLRWTKGYLQCLRILARTQTSKWLKARMLIIYITPALSGVAFLASFYALLHVTLKLGTISAPLQSYYVYFWILITIYTATVALVYTATTLMPNRVRRNIIPYIATLPVYWSLLGFVVLLAPFIPIKSWLKTERR